MFFSSWLAQHWCLSRSRSYNSATTKLYWAAVTSLSRAVCGDVVAQHSTPVFQFEWWKLANGIKIETNKNRRRIKKAVRHEMTYILCRITADYRRLKAKDARKEKERNSSYVVYGLFETSKATVTNLKCKFPPFTEYIHAVNLANRLNSIWQVEDRYCSCKLQQTVTVNTGVNCSW